ncbi:MAG: CBS domain-containing protein [Archangium sp.]|nr:CBS domain-containing protein [Archangium sp.]
MATAMDLMTTKVVTIRQTASVREALKTLDEFDVRHLPVLDERQELVGMLSDRDLLRLKRSQEVLSQPVSEVMSADVLAVTPVTDVVELIDLMAENRIGALPVLDNDSHLAGIVSYVDVLREAGRVLSDHEPLVTS